MTIEGNATLKHHRFPHHMQNPFEFATFNGDLKIITDKTDDDIKKDTNILLDRSVTINGNLDLTGLATYDVSVGPKGAGFNLPKLHLGIVKGRILLDAKKITSDKIFENAFYIKKNAPKTVIEIVGENDALNYDCLKDLMKKGDERNITLILPKNAPINNVKEVNEGAHKKSTAYR